MMKSKQFTSAIILTLLMAMVVGCAESSTTPMLNGRIAFGSDKDGESEIYIMDTDGSNLINLTNNPADDWIVA